MAKAPKADSKTIASAWEGLVTNAKDTGKAVADGFGKAGQKLGAAGAGAGEIGKDAAGIGARAVKAPVRWGINGVSWLFTPVKAAFRKAPLLSSAAVVAGGVWAVGSAVHSSKAKKTRESMGSNQYQITPEEYANMQAQMRQGGGKAGGFAANVQAERAAQGQNAVS